jgi:hypothetical protein
MIPGTPKFNALVVAEIAIDFLKSTAKAKAAFINTLSGETHGWTEGSNTIWSEQTKIKLRELRESMEIDLAVVHFGDTQRTGTAPTSSPFPTNDGLGEHLGLDVDQV